MLKFQPFESRFRMGTQLVTATILGTAVLADIAGAFHDFARLCTWIVGGLIALWFGYRSATMSVEISDEYVEIRNVLSSVRIPTRSIAGWEENGSFFSRISLRDSSGRKYPISVTSAQPLAPTLVIPVQERNRLITCLTELVRDNLPA